MARLLLLLLLLLSSACAPPTAPTSTATADATCIQLVIDGMSYAERTAFDAGLATHTPMVSAIQFAREQAALYQTVPESDSRLLTWFYGGTLRALIACAAGER